MPSKLCAILDPSRSCAWTNRSPPLSPLNSVATASHGMGDDARLPGAARAARTFMPAKGLFRFTMASNIRPLYLLRGVPGFGDGFAIILLPAYLSAVGYSPAEIGIVA